MFNLIKIRTEQVEASWEFVDTLLDKAILRDTRDYEKEDIKEYLMAGTMDLWIGMKADQGVVLAAVSQIVEYPRSKVMSLLYVAAEDHSIGLWLDNCWRDNSPILKHAKEQGVTRIEGFARQGWMKFLKQKGFESNRVVITKDIK